MRIREIKKTIFIDGTHCFLALAQSGEREAPQRFLDTHAHEHSSGSNPEKKKQVEQRVRQGVETGAVSLAKLRRDWARQPIYDLYAIAAVNCVVCWLWSCRLPSWALR